MKNDTANEALNAMIAAMAADVEEIRDRLGCAQDAMKQGNRNGAIGALTMVDGSLERSAAFLAAARAVHIAARK